MPVTDTIADYLTRIRNGYQARHKFVDAPASKLKLALAEILKEQGFLTSVELVDGDQYKLIRSTLRYSEGLPAVREIKRVSTPGRRVYVPVDKLPRVYNGLGIAIISTSRGMMTDKQARKVNMGGEVICTIW